MRALRRRCLGTLASAVIALVLARGAAAQDTLLQATAIEGWKAEHLLVAGFCGLGVLILTFQFILFLRARDRITASDIMRGFSVPLILVGVVSLLGVGYDERQVQPAIALFGTLLGYLLGRGERQDRSGGTTPKPTVG